MPRRWPIFAVIVVAELVFVLGVLRAWPERMHGTGSWVMWLALLVLNVFLAQLLLRREDGKAGRREDSTPDA